MCSSDLGCGLLCLYGDQLGHFLFLLLHRMFCGSAGKYAGHGHWHYRSCKWSGILPVLLCSHRSAEHHACGKLCRSIPGIWRCMSYGGRGLRNWSLQEQSAREAVINIAFCLQAEREQSFPCHAKTASDFASGKEIDQ